MKNDSEILKKWVLRKEIAFEMMPIYTLLTITWKNSHCSSVIALVMESLVHQIVPFLVDSLSGESVGKPRAFYTDVYWNQ